jgi:hypothetical protein
MDVGLRMGAALAVTLVRHAFAVFEEIHGEGCPVHR